MQMDRACVYLWPVMLDAAMRRQRKEASMSEKDQDIKRINELIAIMKANDLVEVEIKHGDEKLVLKRSGPQPPVVTGGVFPAGGVPAPVTGGVSPAAAEVDAAGGQDEGLVEIKSPIVGTFYGTPSPDSDPFVDVGASVEPSTVVCIIEAMKVMNEIKAETSGTIVEVLCSNGEAVEYGQPLFKVRPE